MLGVICHHCPWEEHIIGLHQVLHDISPLNVIALREHTRPDDIRSRMSSSPLDRTHGRTTLSAWHAIIALGKHMGGTMSGVACYHRF
ncbi:hypothetical protein EJD97_002616 [Solanum chilense]|uniref:Uncharacterized protein n=1 Tax=Solanum chilense TaxID=4083 RepID=A0A6N2C421_SOLCI|nr:hypothetical protein EJD97_002616 [Solanum chilense]